MESQIPEKTTPKTSDLTPPPSPSPSPETAMEFETLEDSSIDNLPPPFTTSDPKPSEKSSMEDLIQSFSCSSPETERPNEPTEIPVEDDFLTIPASPLPESNQLDETPISSEFTPFLFPETNPSLTMMGAGLVNLGNTCFLNVILQCFTHTVPFVQSLRSCNHSTPCEGRSKGFCVICTLRDHIELSLSSSGRTVSPYQLVDNLSYLSSSFRRHEQEDAHEFLQCLLDKLDSCSVDVNSKEQKSSEQEESFVKKIFGGRLKSKLQCSNCGHCSDTFEPLIDLSLEIDDVNNLPSALNSFTKVEKIEETKFPCHNCKEDVLVEKQFTLEQTPSVAAFHLKRFKHFGSYVDKIDKYVEYPLELDLQPYSSNQEKNDAELKYDLYAVVVHSGFSSCSGHYICFIRSSPGIWHKLDDSKVTRVREDYVLSQEAYILFYARQGTPWFSTLMETQKQNAVTSPQSVLDDVETLIEPRKKQRFTTSPSAIHNMRETPKLCVTISPKPVHRVPLKISSFSDNISEDDIEDIERVHTAVPLNKFNEELNKANKIIDEQPQTPPRSPSPDYSKDEPADSYYIPRDHLKVKSLTPHSKPGNKAMEDSKRKEAFRLTRSMPLSRANKLRSAIMGAMSDGSVNKKKRKLIDDKASLSGVCRKLNPSLMSF